MTFDVYTIIKTMSDLDKTGAILESCKRDLFLHIKGIKSKLGRNGTFSHSYHDHGQNRTELTSHFESL